WEVLPPSPFCRACNRDATRGVAAWCPSLGKVGTGTERAMPAAGGGCTGMAAIGIPLQSQGHATHETETPPSTAGWNRYRVLAMRAALPFQLPPDRSFI